MSWFLSSRGKSGRAVQGELVITTSCGLNVLLCSCSHDSYIQHNAWQFVLHSVSSCHCRQRPVTSQTAVNYCSPERNQLKEPMMVQHEMWTNVGGEWVLVSAAGCVQVLDAMSSLWSGLILLLSNRMSSLIWSNPAVIQQNVWICCLGVVSCFKRTNCQHASSLTQDNNVRWYTYYRITLTDDAQGKWDITCQGSSL